MDLILSTDKRTNRILNWVIYVALLAAMATIVYGVNTCGADKFFQNKYTYKGFDSQNRPIEVSGLNKTELENWLNQDRTSLTDAQVKNILVVK